MKWLCFLCYVTKIYFFPSLLLSHSEKRGNSVMMVSAAAAMEIKVPKFRASVTAFAEVSFHHKTPLRVSCFESSICSYTAAFLCCFKSDNTVIFCIFYGVIFQFPLWSTHTMRSPVTSCECEEGISISRFCEICLYRIAQNTTLCKHKNCLQYMEVFSKLACLH